MRVSIGVRAYAEIKTTNIRVHEDGIAHTYVFACTATLIHMGREAELTAAVGKMTPTIWKEITKCLYDLGVETVFWEDRTPAGNREIRFDIRSGIARRIRVSENLTPASDEAA